MFDEERVGEGPAGRGSRLISLRKSQGRRVMGTYLVCEFAPSTTDSTASNRRSERDSSHVDASPSSTGRVIRPRVRLPCCIKTEP